MATALSAAKLASALGERFSLVLPPGLEIGVDGTAVMLAETDTGGWRIVDLLWYELAEGEFDVCSAVEQVLDAFQDEAAETTTEPWPAASPGPMPEPFVEIRGGELLAGYGDMERPVLSLRPIPLRGLA